MSAGFIHAVTFSTDSKIDQNHLLQSCYTALSRATQEQCLTGLNTCDLQEEVFPGTPIPLRPDQAELVPSRVQQLLDVFVDRGFAIKVQTCQI